MRCRRGEHLEHAPTHYRHGVTRYWDGAIALLATFALAGQTILAIDRGDSVVNLFSYFTIESNILVLVACVLLVHRPDRGGTAYAILRLGSLTGITITGIVYATVLAGGTSFTGVEWWYDKIFHYVVPAMSVIGYLVFKPRTRLDRTALWFLVFPIAWLVYTLVRAVLVQPTFALTATTSSPVPYDFLDAGAHGAVFVTIACVVLTGTFLLVALGYLRVSRSGNDVSSIDADA